MLPVIVLLSGKQRRIGEAKSIDTLLDVADHEEVAPIRDFPENRLLHAVRILILIHHDFFIALFYRCQSLPLIQYGKSEMLQIAEVQRRLFSLRRVKSLDEICRETAKLRRLRAGSTQILEQGFFRLGKKRVLQFLQRRRDVRFPPIFIVKTLGLIVDFHFSGRVKRRESFRQRGKSLLHGCPRARRRSMGKIVDQLAVRRKSLLVGLDAVQTSLICKILRSIPARGQRPVYSILQIRVPMRLLDGALPPFGNAPGNSGNPRLRVRLAFRETVQIQHHFVKRRIVAVRTVASDKAQKIRVLLLVVFLEQIPDHPLPHQFPLLFVEQPEFRIDVDRREIFPNQPLAKGMKRGNGRVGKQYELVSKLRVRFQFVRQLFLDALAHFCRRRVCEGDDKKLVDPVFPVDNVFDDPLHQRICLAGTGRRRNEQIAVSFRHSAELAHGRSVIILSHFRLPPSVPFPA